MSQEVRIEKEVQSVMRDGIALYANIYRPAESAEELPVLLTRLPYNKNHPHFSHRYIDPLRLALEGYIVVVQDVRGRFASEGEFSPFIQEFNDGFDSVEWAASLPGASGEVGMFGLSYYGFTQLFAAMMQPPSLKVIAPAFTGHDINQSMINRNGALQTSKIQTWLLESVAPDMLRREGASAEDMEKLFDHLDHLTADYGYRPLKDWLPMTDHGGRTAKLHENMLNGKLIEELNETQPAFIEDITVPGLHIAGWYDCFLQPTLNNYSAMQQNGRPQQLIIGPWGHGVMTPYLGDKHFGIRASGENIDGKGDLTDLHISWFRRFLKGLPQQPAPVKLFVMGENVWREENEWPPAGAVKRSFYFQPSEKLAEKPLLETVPLSYDYDPKDPVPTIGGATLFYQGINTGPLEQKSTAFRNDVLMFETSPLVQRTEVTGPVTVTLFAVTDAPDTNFTAKLTDVDEDGNSIILTEGIVRAREKVDETALKSGEPILYTIDLWATSNVFFPGHRIRVEISSSNFPKYAVNLNTGKTAVESAESQTARQTIFTGGEYASFITLPVMGD